MSAAGLKKSHHCLALVGPGLASATGSNSDSDSGLNLYLDSGFGNSYTAICSQYLSDGRFLTCLPAGRKHLKKKIPTPTSLLV